MIPYHIPSWLLGKNYKKPESKEEKFREQLICGRSYEPLVGAFLANHGVLVEMAAATDEEHQTKRKQIPDILANGFRIECKSSKLKSLPKWVEVDSIKSWLRKKTKPDFYVIVSKRTWKMIWVPGHDSSLWKQGRAHGKPYFLALRETFRPIEELVPLLHAPQ